MRYDFSAELFAHPACGFMLKRKKMYFPARFTQEQQEELISGINLQHWPSTGEPHGEISRAPLTNAKDTALVFHGNAGSALHRMYYIDASQSLGYRVIITEYPGYGMRRGTPSEAALIKDGIVTAKMAWYKFKEPLILSGESLGNGVVAGIVASREVSVEGLLIFR